MQQLEGHGLHAMTTRAKGQVPKSADTNIVHASKRGPEGNETEQATLVKPKAKRRKIGKFVQFINLPLDIVFEITSKLEPLHVLHLSRVSRQFMNVLANPNARHVWVAARRNIPDLPDCPTDMTEMQYASLLFERTCYACGKRGLRTDFSLRKTFCRPCLDANVQLGYDFFWTASSVDLQKLLPLLPRSMLRSDQVWSEAERNNGGHSYYIPEFKLIISRYQELRADKAALERFMEQRKTITAQIMKHAEILHYWESSSTEDKKSNAFAQKDQFKAAVEMELFEHGYDATDLPVACDRKHSVEGGIWLAWRKLVYQSRVLTPRIWTNLLPKLEEILEKQKKLNLKRRRNRRLAKRAVELRNSWNAFVTLLPNEQLRSTMPTASYVQNMRFMEKLMAEDDAKIPMTASRLRANTQPILDHISNRHKLVKCELVKLVHQSATAPPSDDLALLDRVSSIFHCPCRSQYDCHELLDYPSLMHHKHFKSSGSIWARLPVSMRVKSETAVMAAQVLEHLGLADAPNAQSGVHNNYLFLCRCGHPKLRDPVTLAVLVFHLLQENEWYNKLEKEIKVSQYTENLILINDHDLEGGLCSIEAVPRNGLATISKDTSSAETKLDSVANESPTRLYCLTCWILTSDYFALASPEELKYHAQRKHNCEIVDCQAVPFKELLNWQKGHPDHDPIAGLGWELVELIEDFDHPHYGMAGDSRFSVEKQLC